MKLSTPLKRLQTSRFTYYLCQWYIETLHMNFLLQGLRILCKSLYDDTYAINLPFLSLAMLLAEFTLTFIILFVYHFLTHNNTIFYLTWYILYSNSWYRNRELTLSRVVSIFLYHVVVMLVLFIRRTARLRRKHHEIYIGNNT